MQTVGDIDDSQETLPAVLEAPGGDFDYGLLGEHAAIARVAADRIRIRSRKLAEEIAELGLELISLRGLLKGHFIAWLKSEFGWGKSTAYRYMWLGENFHRFSHSGNFSVSAMQMLSAPGVPDSALALANELAEAGTKVTEAIADQLIDEAKLGTRHEIDVDDDPAEDSDVDDAADEEEIDDVELDGLSDDSPRRERERPESMDDDLVDESSDPIDGELLDSEEDSMRPLSLQIAERRIEELSHALETHRKEHTQLVAVCRFAAANANWEPIVNFLNRVDGVDPIQDGSDRTMEGDEHVSASASEGSGDSDRE